MICARCHRPIFRAIVPVQVGTENLAYGPHCAVVLGYRLPPVKRKQLKPRRPRARDTRQAALALEASP
jgi:hypothetical protein